MTKMMRTIPYLAIGLILAAGADAPAQIRFRVKPYIGVGMKFALQMNDPDYTPIDYLDSTYYDLHLDSPRRYHFHFHARLMFLELWNVSLGYMLWNH